MLQQGASSGCRCARCSALEKWCSLFPNDQVMCTCYSTGGRGWGQRLPAAVGGFCYAAAAECRLGLLGMLMNDRELESLVNCCTWRQGLQWQAITTNTSRNHVLVSTQAKVCWRVKHFTNVFFYIIVWLTACWARFISLHLPFRNTVMREV